MMALPGWSDPGLAASVHLSRSRVALSPAYIGASRCVACVEVMLLPPLLAVPDGTNPGCVAPSALSASLRNGNLTREECLH